MGTDTTTGCVAAWSFDNHPSPGIEPASTPPTTHQHQQSRRTTQTISGRGIYLPLRRTAVRSSTRRVPTRPQPEYTQPRHSTTPPDQPQPGRESQVFHHICTRVPSIHRHTLTHESPPLRKGWGGGTYAGCMWCTCGAYGQGGEGGVVHRMHTNRRRIVRMLSTTAAGYRVAGYAQPTSIYGRWMRASSARGTTVTTFECWYRPTLLSSYPA
jgi:hypothetical protein